MDKEPKDALIKLGLSIIPILVIIILFSTPLGMIPPLGDLINPNGGIWDVSTHAEHGSKTITIPGVNEEVICYYDEWGIPHIFAQTDYDMYFTMGYVHARDRLFQLDMIRRLYTGRVSELLGEYALPSDKFYRNLCLERAANASWNMMLAEQPNSGFVKSLEAYANGINYYIDHLSPHEVPLEFRLLNYRPSHWLPHHSIAYGKYMSFGLAHGQFREFTLSLLSTHFSENEILELYPINNTAGVVPVLPNYGSYPSPPTPSATITTPMESSSEGSDNEIPKGVINSISRILSDIDKIDEIVIDSNSGFKVKDYATVHQTILGSNNWIIDGNISSTGFPILANDMHLQLVMPSVWYEIQHASAESNENVYGFSFVGAPGVIAGHNQYASWGYTNVGADVTDYYYYNVSADGTKYLNGTEWQDFVVINETIPVMGSPDVEYSIRFTGHGPIISPGISSHLDATDYSPIAMRWTGLDDLVYGKTDYLFRSVFNIRRSHTLNDFIEAQKDWGIPGQNLAIATSDGHIAIRPVAHYPIRPQGN